MNEKINPANLKQQAIILREHSSYFTESCNKLVSIFNSINNIIDLEDMGLSNSLNNLVDAYADIGFKTNNHLNELADSMDNWADRTIGCEQESREKLQRITSGLNDIGLLLDKLR